MQIRRSIPIAVGMSLALGIALVASGVTLAGGRPFTVAPLTGAAERPGPGDPDGTGSASFWMNPGTGQVCWDYSVSGVETLGAAHIHHAPAGVPGPVVIPMLPTSATGGAGCATVARSLIIDILVHPSDYYFNVHNATYPAGALRGQLSRQP
ncbi:MAG TPA: CHRD domain-containing protein [Candidatus Saccharimonadia bacterium]|nr:CHRD domain-containing protein [Candidatus Saccharimonadia bacterium]